jgi:predicted porin
MKKNLTALALCSALAGPALAQSSVTIYGIVDLGITKQNAGTTTLAGGNGATGAAGDKLEIRQAYASRLGFSGTEDLGGGLRANFNLETRFSADTGLPQSSTQYWFGRSTVSLSGPFGQVLLGRDFVPAFYVALAADPFQFNGVGQMAGMHLFPGYSTPDTTGPVQGVRSDNLVHYRIPALGGFTASLAMSASEGNRGTLGREVGGNVEYRSGPLYVGVGFDQTQNNGVGHDPRLIVSTVTYAFGGVRAMLGWGRGRSALLDDTVGLNLGLNVNVGAGVIHTLVARLNPPADNDTLLKYAIGYEYFLSKRTSLYADVSTARQQSKTRTTALDSGMTFRF